MRNAQAPSLFYSIRRLESDIMISKDLFLDSDLFLIFRLQYLILPFIFQGYTPLHIAMQFRHENVYKLLVEVYGKCLTYFLTYKVFYVVRCVLTGQTQKNIKVFKN